MEVTGRRRIALQLHSACITNREEAPMTGADYRAMASEIRDLIPLLLHAQAVADLRLLADRYESWRTISKQYPAHCRTRFSSNRRQAS